MSRQRIDPTKLKRGSIRHEVLPLSLVARINYLCSALHEVHPMSIEEWLDGFRWDANPESEVRWWERVTRLYTGYSETRDLSAEQQKALFSVVFRLGMGLDDEPLVAELAKLPGGAMEEILALTGERIQ
jgi:hypothetical protein